MQAITATFTAHFWLAWLGRAWQGLLIAIPVAALFEVAGWLLRRYTLARLAPALTRDADREPVSRARRRRALRDLTQLGLRWLTNIVAVTVILTLWRVDPLAVAVLLATAVYVARQPLADLLAGYGLLLDDCLAPGDKVILNGRLTGTVAEVGPRRLRLTDEAGLSLWVPASEVKTVQTLTPATGPAEDR